MSQLRLYLKNGKDLSRQTSQSFLFLSPLKHVKRSAQKRKGKERKGTLFKCLVVLALKH